MMADAAWRLSWVGLLFAGTAVMGYFARRALIGWSFGAMLTPQFQDLFALVNIALGIAVHVAARRRLLPPKQLLDLGLVFLVVGAFNIAMLEFWDPLPANFSFTFIPAECVWIVAFALIVPNTPGRVLVSSLLAASGAPLALAISAAVAGRTVEQPMVHAVYFLTSTYLCAIVAYAVARIVNRVNTRLKHAREVGSYELVSLIGEGGMGEVWEAKHRLLARPAAIKLIRGDALGSSRATRDMVVRRFEREAQETATLGSTHTIDVYDFGITEDGDFYYVMELLRGMSLERYVQDFGPMEPARAIYLLRQICHSLIEAHGRGLIHRDIKPANIFMCRLGPDDDFVKVLDFGLVKHFETAGHGTMLTMEGQTAGTPAYMAPEVAMGSASVDGRSDLYSLACVAYYLLTGQPVFTGDSAVAIVLAHVKDQPVPPSVRSEFPIPAALDALILELLDKEPTKRPASAAELSRRLKQIDVPTPWSQDAAHAWWELHHVSAIADVAADEKKNDDAADESPVARPRCWPRFDRTPAGDKVASA
jgi:eukaryotic-like serine/threonine-protein kinase